MNINDCKIKLKIEEEKRILASKNLATHFHCDSGELFYRFLKGEIPERGEFGERYAFHFHGYGCTITNLSTNDVVDLEFGPDGLVSAFDKYTITRLLGGSIADTDRIIDLLMKERIIKPANNFLYQLAVEGEIKKQNWESVEKSMDACVADRLVII